jgi:hypothetical protein
MNKPRPPNSATINPLPIFVLFFFSGATGLLYEVAWFRGLQLVFGVSAFAIGAVACAFMLGMVKAALCKRSGSTQNAREALAPALAIEPSNANALRLAAEMRI